jgi:anti-sigma regulatory factor (Ser/Thr protein kinase)
MRLTPDRSSVRLARQFVRATLESHQVPPEILDATELLASELVTNAIVHTGAPCELSVQVGRHDVRVEVRDDSRKVPVRRPIDRSAQSGRGLLIVDAMAKDWGTELLPDNGKRVWFQIDR